jgi:hypothetical protein
MDKPVKLDLDETGTRFQFYMELRDTFAEAVISLENSLKVEHNLTTVEHVKKLQTAVNLIEARVNFLSDFNRLTTRYSPWGQTLAAIAPHRSLQLVEVNESTRQECEEELRKAKETGYAEDSGQKDSAADKGEAS